MARFVCYTHKTQTAQGERSALVFVNVEHISKAVYDNGTLTLIFSTGIPVANKGDSIQLTGDEADQALKVIQSLR